MNRPSVLVDPNDLAGGTSLHHGVTSESQGKETEVILADMENRLRNTTIRILRPALEQISELDHRVRLINTTVDRQADLAAKVDKLAGDFSANEEFSKVLQETILETKEQLRILDRSTAAKLVETRAEQAEFGKSIQDHKSDLLRLGREDSRIWEESKRLHEQHESEQKAREHDISTLHRKLNRTKEDLEGMINDLIKQRAELIDDLYGEGTGLNALSRKLDSLTHGTECLPQIQKLIVDLGADIRLCKSQQEQQEGQHQDFQQVFDDYLAQQKVNEKEMREEFKHQSNQLVAHTAQLMKGVRSSYQKELDSVKDLRVAFTKTLQNADNTRAELEQRVMAESRRMETLHRELTQDMEELSNRRKKDRVNLESEHREFKNQMTTDREVVNKTRSTVDYLARLVGVIIESSRIGCALEVQDFADRTRECWLCVPSESAKAAAEPLRAIDLEKQKQSKLQASVADNKELFTDVRKGLGRSGYRPGQVPFSGHNFDRRDLLILHNRLLIKAQQQFLQGPDQPGLPSRQSSAVPAKSQSVTQFQRASLPAKGSQQAASVSEIAMQPSARGGASADEGRPLSKGYPAGKDLDGYWPSSERPGSQGGSFRPGSQGGRQRPGSQGQPQAVGSRGTALGPLGETEPPAGSESPVRLPSIANRGRNGSITVR